MPFGQGGVFYCVFFGRDECMMIHGNSRVLSITSDAPGMEPKPQALTMLHVNSPWLSSEFFRDLCPN